ncbi:MAG: hypothetical protein CVU89_15100 [Firmicutes bacterium HGW-Firmicutes-14]|nr:MAG: hypothetical protein CVU89_15100 [Firmicutes bacterium HGW-Firmicutes-14]
MRMPVVKIDHSRCVDSRECGKCLGICPVLTTYPEGPPFKEGVGWRISPTFVSLCTGCGECARLCPESAISVDE